MGRTEKSQGLAPPAIRKDIRAKQARHIINKVVPGILASNARARKGSEDSELIVNPAPYTADSTAKAKEEQSNGGDDAKYIKRKGQGRRKAKNTLEDEDSIALADEKPRSKKAKDVLSEPLTNMSLGDVETRATPIKIRIVATDTLSAARMIVSKGRNQPNPCVLNMASPLRPGGGVLMGATSQEEYLCARTSLLPSLKESFYRLPELGGVFTKDVIVFRNHLSLGDTKGEYGPTERWWIDVVSAGMLRFPDLEGGEEEEKRLNAKDRKLVEAKMRAVLRIACGKGVKKIVLGAWGCGAYGNPVRDIAEAWQNILLPLPDFTRKGKSKQPLETWSSLEEVLFAVTNRKMAAEFARAFGDGVEVEIGPCGHEEEDDEDETDQVAEELRAKITEMEDQIGKVWNADLKQRMTIILDGLKAQLREREETSSDQSEESQHENEVNGMRDAEEAERHIEESTEYKDEDEDEEEEEEEEDSSIEDIRNGFKLV